MVFIRERVFGLMVMLADISYIKEETYIRIRNILSTPSVEVIFSPSSIDGAVIGIEGQWAP